MQAALEQKRLMMLEQLYLSIIEYPKYGWYGTFGHKRLCYRRATARTFTLKLLYSLCFP